MMGRKKTWDYGIGWFLASVAQSISCRYGFTARFRVSGLGPSVYLHTENFDEITSFPFFSLSLSSILVVALAVAWGDTLGAASLEGNIVGGSLRTCYITDQISAL